MSELVPAGLRLRSDAGTRLLRGGARLGGGAVLVGGSPVRVLRLTPAGARQVAGWLDGEPVPDSAAARRLARRLLDAGIAHPDFGAPSRSDPRSRDGARSRTGRAVPRSAGGFHGQPGAVPLPGEVTVVIPVRDRHAELARCLAGLRDAADAALITARCGGAAAAADGNGEATGRDGGAAARHGGPAGGGGGSAGVAASAVPRVIVVDDCSADPGAIAAIASGAGARVIRRPVNGGPGAARNTGLAAATTGLVAFLDSDCVPAPGWLSALLPHFTDPGCGAVAPRIVSCQPAPSGGQGRPPRPPARPPVARVAPAALRLAAALARFASPGAPRGGRQGRGGRQDQPPRAASQPRAAGPAAAPGENRETWLARYEGASSTLDMGGRPSVVRPGARVPYVPGAALVVRRAAAGDGFRRGMDVGEDVDFVWRLAAAGWRVRYEPAAVMAHQHRVRLRPWFARRVDYGTSAAVLEGLHPGVVRPMRASWWTAAAWTAVLAGRLAGHGRAGPAAGIAAAAAITGTATALLARRLSRLTGEAWPLPDGGTSHAWRMAARLAGGGALAASRPLGSALSRTWWPVAIPAALAVPRLRLPVAALVIAPPLLDWAARRPPLDPARYVAARLLDDAAYGAGVWQGCARRRDFRALLPVIGSRRDRSLAAPLARVTS